MSSMPNWLHDAPPVLPHENGVFNPAPDPSMAYMSTPTSGNFDFNNSLQNRPLQHPIQNGHVRNGSPAYLNSGYQTQSVVPSKRPRPRDDVYGASPQQLPGALPNSRSQTPQQVPYTPFQGATNGLQPSQTPTPYSHLQHGIPSNTSPSPVMHDPQHYNPQPVSQRMQTASPSPFSPAPQSYAAQSSPPHSDYGGRVDTPQNGTSSYLQSLPYGSGTAQQLMPAMSNPNATIHAAPMSAYGGGPTSLEQQRKMYDMRQQQMVRQLQVSQEAAQHRSSMGPGNAMSANIPQQARPQMMQPAGRSNAELLMRHIMTFMNNKGLPFNPMLIVAGRQFSPVQLWAAVVQHGGSQKVNMGNAWPNIAAMLQVPPMQFPTAPQELRTYWQNNLAPYEHATLVSKAQQQQQQRERQQRAPSSQASLSPAFQGRDPSALQDSFSPVKPLPPQYQQSPPATHSRRTSGADFQAPHMQQHSADTRHTQTNGFSGTLGPHQLSHQPVGFNLVPPPTSIQPHSHPQRPGYGSTNVPAIKKESYSGSGNSGATAHSASNMPRKAPMEAIFKPKYHDTSRNENTNANQTANQIASHGGIDVPGFRKVVDGMLEVVPIVPSIGELGIIDIRALTMSLRSGLHAEVRLALDTLATLSSPDSRLTSLEECEELVEALTDCAEEQVEFLAENAAEVSDVMLIAPYEEVVRGCRGETELFQDCPDFGTLDYDLDRSAERLICITTILRNLASVMDCRATLAEPFVLKFITTVMRYLGTRNMLLRTYRNTLDFAKDMVLFLSNLSEQIDLPGKEEASCILHFLLSFAPSPPPYILGSDDIIFSSYHPSSHPYLPPAIDSLAKLLARDPNRVYFKGIFAADTLSTPPYDLLTRSFGLAISPLPDGPNKEAVIEARKPYIAQGMLAGEILVSMIPPADSSLARSWLNSKDGFATTLLQVVWDLNEKFHKPPTAAQQRHSSANRTLPLEVEANSWISNRGLGILYRLAQKAKDSELGLDGISLNFGTGKMVLLRSLMKDYTDANWLRQLSIFAGPDR